MVLRASDRSQYGAYTPFLRILDRSFALSSRVLFFVASAISSEFRGGVFDNDNKFCAGFIGRPLSSFACCKDAAHTCLAF